MRISGDASSKDMLEVLINAAGLGRKLESLEDKILLIQEKTALLDHKTIKMGQQAEEMFKAGQPNGGASGKN